MRGMRFLLAVFIAAWMATRFADTDNGVALGLCVASALIAIGTQVEYVIRAIEEGRHGDGRA